MKCADGVMSLGFADQGYLVEWVIWQCPSVPLLDVATHLSCVPSISWTAHFIDEEFVLERLHLFWSVLSFLEWKFGLKSSRSSGAVVLKLCVCYGPLIRKARFFHGGNKKSIFPKDICLHLHVYRPDICSLFAKPFNYICHNTKVLLISFRPSLLSPSTSFKKW